ncbi:MaoC/PaaZ C-terminal domain-containing protein [Streptomyces sp. DW26H14]|uniref:MaoC/PaaZ C-terminal domain-containing protein n=1 Tax=Streptomyces sp. DW26H14 TaxID=3435395 RepID=UPI00403D5F1C
MAVPAANVGDEVTFSKTVSESDVYLFAGITGDLSPNHVDEQTMSTTPYGGRIAHGALMVGFMSTTSTRMIEKLGATAVSYGYDRVRFTRPVRFGDTVTVRYRIAEIDPERPRTHADIDVTNQRGETVAVARHTLHFL